jgi:signal transduction histidine kinase
MRTLPEIGDRLRSTIALDLPVVNGYPAHLRMAIRNLIENAARYSKSDVPIFLRAFAQDADVIIEVEDEGIGISQESIGHIFETFWRSDEAHTTPGFGLGLAITRKVVDLHGGRIEVTSEVGKGSLFRIRLPVERSNVPE